MTHASLHWYKSSYSTDGGQCVEVAADLVASHGVVPVRDSKIQAAPSWPCPPRRSPPSSQASRRATSRPDLPLVHRRRTSVINQPQRGTS
ncbi:DUF397 domain-containing protein [Actinomadura keratinilytica]